MGTLLEDLKESSDYVVRMGERERRVMDYTIDSLIEIDKILEKNMKDGKPIPGSQFPADRYGSILFSLGAYVGETIIRNVAGARWITDDEKADGEITVSVQLPDGTKLWPVLKVWKRSNSGFEDAIYPYAFEIVSPFKKLAFNQSFWEMGSPAPTAKAKKPWWKLFR